MINIWRKCNIRSPIGQSNREIPNTIFNWLLIQFE